MQDTFSLPISRLFPRKNQWKIVTLSLFILLSLAILQDFLQSGFKNSSFYFSESLLFRSYWLLFVPGILLQVYILKFFEIQCKLRSNIAVFYTAIAALLFTVFHILTFSLIVYILSLICLDHTYSFTGTIFYSLGEDLYKYVLVYTLAGVCYNFRYKENGIVRPAISTHKIISVGAGLQKAAIKVEDIIFITASSPYIFFHTKDKKYIHQQTLKSILEKLPAEQFIRVHKSGIVNMEKVLSYKSRLNGDYDIILKDEKEVRLSRNFAAAFKKRFL